MLSRRHDKPDDSAVPKKRVLSESMHSPQLQDKHSSDIQVTPKHSTVSSSQGSQGLRRSVGLLNLSLDSSPKPHASPKFALLKKKISDQEMEETNIDVENWSPFKEPSTPSTYNNQLKRPASNSSTSLSPFISDAQKPLIFSSSKKNASIADNRSSIQMKFNKVRKMMSLDSVGNDIDSLPNPSLHLQANKENLMNSPTNSPSRPSRQKINLEHATSKNLSNVQLTYLEKEADFITPNSYKFVKPLQTAFMSSGLLSKKNRTTSESFHPPETPCKKQLPLGVQPITQKSTFTSSNLANVITASSPMINDNSTPKHMDDESVHGSPYDHSPSHHSVGLPRSSRALNTNGLRDCIWRFASDFDDSNESIFDESIADGHDPLTPTRLKDAKRALIKNLRLDTDAKYDADELIPRTPLDLNAMVDTSGDLSNTSSLGLNASSCTTSNSNVDDHLISKFDNVQLVGSGEFSNVYEITFQSVKYAVKRIKTPFLGAKRRKRIFEEVELLKTLQENAPNDDEGKEYVINFLNGWEQSDHLYIMMEFCENGPLDKFLADMGKSSKLDEWRIWKIMLELSMALKYIHSCNILHLDLKPANIFITFEGSLKIGDFGMATKHPASSAFEREGDREYIAPEIINQSKYDKPADIFSFGLIMVEIAANIVLPENGLQWHKLRSGDLSEAGRLSSGDLNANLFNDSMYSRTSTYSSPLNITTLTSSYSFAGDSRKLPPWTPRFLVDGKGALDKLVQRMIKPSPEQRPTAAELCNTMELQFIETRRKAGAVIYEGEHGPPPDMDEDMLMNNDLKSLNLGYSLPLISIPGDIMDQDEW